MPKGKLYPVTHDIPMGYRDKSEENIGLIGAKGIKG